MRIKSHIGQNEGCGIPFYLNGEIAGWVCTSINSTYRYNLATHRVDDSPYFKTERECSLALMRIFGE